MQIKTADLEQTLCRLLRGFGLKVGNLSCGKLAVGIRELVNGHVMPGRIAEPMLTAREALRASSTRCIARSWQSSRRIRSAGG